MKYLYSLWCDSAVIKWTCSGYTSHPFDIQSTWKTIQEVNSFNKLKSSLLVGDTGWNQLTVLITWGKCPNSKDIWILALVFRSSCQMSAQREAIEIAVSEREVQKSICYTFPFEVFQRMCNNENCTPTCHCLPECRTRLETKCLTRKPFPVMAASQSPPPPPHYSGSMKTRNFAYFLLVFQYITNLLSVNPGHWPLSSHDEASYT